MARMPAWAQSETEKIFAHVSQLPGGTISVGDQATFDVMPDPYKPGRKMATNIRLIDGDEKQTDDEGAGAGMYAEPDTDSALAAGLRKVIGNR